MKPKSLKEQMKFYKSLLHHHQMWGRIERRWAKQSDEKCKEIAKKMREIQRQMNRP